MHCPKRRVGRCAGGLFALVLSCLPLSGAGAATGEPLILVVMDPLAKELACACIKGYAQRDYGTLAQRLEQRLHQRVLIDFSDNLADSMDKFRTNRDVLVVGKDSVVRQGAAPAGLKCRPVARLTGLDGTTTLTGLFVVKSADPAKGLTDLAGRRVLFGRADAEEKHAAALAALRAAGVEPPAKLETRESCSDAALDLLDGSAPAPVAVISSYALALLEGCGSIKKGDLKVIGKTAAVPFITAFMAESMSAEKQKLILDLLLSVKSDAALLKAMESLQGFQPMEVPGPKEAGKAAVGEWPDWRGPGRDGQVPALPDRLPARPKFVWKKAAVSGGLAGLSVSDQKLLVAERDLGNKNDVLRCLDAQSGETQWRFEFPAVGKLDYGEAPRAAPVARDGRVFFLGAFGDLHCLGLKDGKPLWRRQLVKEFRGKLPTWGTCSVPLLVDGNLIVNPGAPGATLVALDAATGRVVWQVPGQPAAYASFVCAELGGRRQIVGYDQPSLGGWDPRTGERIWRLVPPHEGDFNVPTPLVVGGRLLVSTENNGTRLYGFEPGGRIIPEPVAQYAELAPDTSSPVATPHRLLGTHQGLHCLDLKDLRPIWRLQDDGFADHACLFADANKVLVVTLGGELILLAADSDQAQILSRLKVFEDEVEVYSHPALVGTRLYIRGGSTVACVELGPS